MKLLSTKSRSSSSSRYRQVLIALVLLLSPIVGWGQVSSTVVISQVYGGGGNAGAPFTNDFIELHNVSNATVSLAGYSVQYATATGISWNVTNLTGSIPAGGYYLVQEAAGATPSTALPAPDASGNIAMSATAGKVALVSATVPLSGPCPTAGVVDFVGYGTTADCFEGAGRAPAPSNTTAVIRVDNGCRETNNNNLDFTTGAPTPRNSASAPNVCAPLPVELVSFAAERQAEGVRVTWATATETNNAYFEVQRSATGKEFRTFATVEGKGNSSRLQTYAVLDRQPLAGTSYYRLRQVDIDGTASFSPVAAVTATNELAIYPNPTRGELSLQVPGGAARYRVLSLIGRVVLEGQAPTGSTTLELVSLPAGLYQLEVISAAGRVVRKVVKE